MELLHALSLIVFMEARNQPPITQQYLVSFAIEAARERKISVKQSLHVKGLYSWNWDGINTPVDKKFLVDKIYPVVKRELARKKRSLTGFKHFNNCSGKKFPGFRFKSNDICFYKGK